LTEPLKSRSSSFKLGNGIGLKSPAAMSRVRRSISWMRRLRLCAKSTLKRMEIKPPTTARTSVGPSDCQTASRMSDSG
jgi:hypothetical protein